MKPGTTCRFVCTLGAVALQQGALAAPLLRCEVTYAGATQQVQARMVDDPYSVPSVDIGGRFHFKAVMVGRGEHIESIALYAYLDTRHQPILGAGGQILAALPQRRHALFANRRTTHLCR